MITTTIAKTRIQQLIKQDENSDNRLSGDTRWALLFIEHHLHAFFAHYAQDNRLSMQQASQRIDSWDVRQWKQAVNAFDMSSWSSEATNRVNAYASSASINKGHMMSAIAVLSLIWLGTKREDNINQRIVQDGQQQVRWITRNLNLSKQQESRALSRIGNRNLRSEATSLLGRTSSNSIITRPETTRIWSRNLWNETDTMANDVESLVNKHLRHSISIQDLEDMLTQHQNPKQFKPNQSIGDRVKQMEFNTRRIVRTESSRLIHQVNVSTYEQVGIDLVNFTNQPGACLKCQGIADHNPYRIEDCPDIPGDSHPNCRCIITPAGDSHSRFITGNHLY